MLKRTYKLGTRGSKLALWQAYWVKERLVNRNPGLSIELVKITTTGDRDQTSPLDQLGDTGVFIKEIERSLRKGEIDFAVHSAKDLPSEIHEDFDLMAFTEREDPRDVLLAQNGWTLKELPPKACLATGSLRRKAQLLAYGPEFQFKNLRGNIDTRLRKYQESDWDGIVVAWAGIKRMGYRSYVTEFLPPEICLPAVGQGAIAIEGRRHDREVRQLVRSIAHPETEGALRAEREFLRQIEGGCHVPVGALGQVVGNQIILTGMVASLDGRKILREKVVAHVEEPEKAGEILAQKMLQQSAREILKGYKRN
ncbi:porphobilinogen deaminase [bacterium BMS3Abin05]|nr:porphobilinogen deaminase [bacterium BMS3Abin05]